MDRFASQGTQEVRPTGIHEGPLAASMAYVPPPLSPPTHFHAPRSRIDIGMPAPLPPAPPVGFQAPPVGFPAAGPQSYNMDVTLPAAQPHQHATTYAEDKQMHYDQSSANWKRQIAECPDQNPIYTTSAAYDVRSLSKCTVLGGGELIDTLGCR